MPANNNTHFFIIVFTIFVSLILHFPVFNYDLVGYHVWRQTQTQQVIENFCTRDFCIFNPRLNNLAFPDGIMRMEFPLYQWIIACFCKISGNHVLTTRIVTFIIGIFTIFGFYLLSVAVFKNKIFAAIGAWAICFSPVFYYYTINPLPDNLALCFGIYGLYFFVKYYYEIKTKYIVLFFFFISLSVLCKLPFILFITPFAVYWATSTKKMKEFLFGLILLLPAGIWYLSVIGSWGDNGIVKGIFNNNIDLLTYLDYIQHNFISTLPELYINYAALCLFGVGIFYLFKNKVISKNKLAKYFFIGLISVIGYSLFELNMIAKVHDYYLFPFLPFIFLISLYGLKILIEQKKKYLRIMALVCILFLPVTAYLRSQTRWNLTDPGFNPALLMYKEQIQKIIPENAICLTGNDDSGMVYLYYLKHNGYTFYEDQISVDIIKKYIKKGVTYLVSDATLDEETKRYLASPVATFMDVKIFKLK